MPPVDDIMGWFFKLILAGIMSFMWWGKKEDKKLLKAHSDDIVKLQTQAVTEDKVRRIVTEALSDAIHPMHENIVDIKRLVTDNSDLVKQLQIKMAVQDGYQQAMKELNIPD
jgi:hypothetical protein